MSAIEFITIKNANGGEAKVNVANISRVFDVGNGERCQIHFIDKKPVLNSLNPYKEIDKMVNEASERLNEDARKEIKAVQAQIDILKNEIEELKPKPIVIKKEHFVFPTKKS